MDLMEELNKYQILIVNKINDRIKKWNERNSVQEKEMYHFLHNIKDTAESINQIELAQLASDKLHYVAEDSIREWSTGKRKAFLKDLINLSNINNSHPVTSANIILLIDDDVEFISFVKNELEKNGYHVLIALNAEKGLEVFYTMKPVFVMLDIDLAKGKEIKEIDGEQYLLQKSLKADVAIIRAWKADRLGNLVYYKTAQNFNPNMATAASYVIAEVDEIVEVGDLSPDEITTPHLYIDAIVKSEWILTKEGVKKK